MNILLASVGRRTYLVDYFKQALGESGQVFVANSSEQTTAFSYADKSVVTPLIYDETYIPFLLSYCKENKIEAIISLFDIDLPILSKNRDKFKNIGVKLIVSDYEFVSVCNDKWKSYLYLKDKGFNVGKTYININDVLLALDNGELTFPIIIKPRFGMGSIGVQIAEDKEELFYMNRKCQKRIEESYLKYESAEEENCIIYQEVLKGQEYGVDIINNLKGENVAAVVKKKVAMRAGETDISETVDEPKLKNDAVRLGKLTGHIANLDSDWFMVDGVPYILEMNARFGGGYPFSHAAGINLPLAIVKWLNNEKVDNNLFSYETGVKAAKEIQIKILK